MCNCHEIQERIKELEAEMRTIIYVAQRYQPGGSPPPGGPGILIPWIIESIAERARAAEANYQFMVNRAADEKLDGYRELGSKAAKAEERAEAAERNFRAYEDVYNCSIERLKELAKQHGIWEQVACIIKELEFERCCRASCISGVKSR